MTRTINRLNHKQVQSLSKAGRYADGGGLYLVIRKSGTKAWVFRYTADGKKRDLGLGPYRDISLASARDRASRNRELVEQGGDPVATKNAAQPDLLNHATRAELTFGEYALMYVDQVTPNFRNPKHRQQWRNSLVTHAAPMWKKPIAEVDTDDVLSVLLPIWTDIPETARRVRSRIEAILSSAELEKLRPESRNPAQWRGYLEHHRALQSAPQPKHHAAMPFDKVPSFYISLEQREAIAALVLRFIILTAVRSGEGRGARWDEIDFDEAVWTIPAERMKANVEHRVPLSRQAIDLIRPLSEVRINDLVFPGQRTGNPLTDSALTNLIRKRMDMHGFTVHGFRTAFRNWCSDIDRTDRDLAEASLAHRIPNAVERAYNRTDMLELRRGIMQRWGDFATSGASVNVVPLRKQSS